MGFAIPVLGAVSTVMGIAGQARQANAQRDQVRAQNLAAEQQYRLQLQRFEYAKNDAASTYMREALVAQEMHRNAQTQFSMAEVQQSTANRYAEVEESQQNTTLANRVTQLLASADSVRGQASLSNAGMYQNLVRSMGGNEEAANAFLQNMMAMGADSSSAEAVRRQSLLANVAAYQGTLEAANTQTRVSGFQAEAATDEAKMTESYRKMTQQFLTSQRQSNQQFQRATTAAMPSILDLQHQRNMVSLNTASYARQAEMSLGQQSALIGQQLQQSVGQAQMQGIPSMGGIVAQGLAGLASQTVPFILQNRQQQQQGMARPPVGGLNGYTNQYPVIEFGQPAPWGQAPQVQWGQPLPINRMQDVSGRIYA